MLSILVLCYNHENYIKTAIDSILKQNLIESCEIIVIDDCSTDNTFKIINDSLVGAQNTHIISNSENHGIVRNYQKGFSLCTGDLIFVLEGDDYWQDPDKISIISEIMKSESDISMCFHDYQILNQQNILTDRILHTDISDYNYISTNDLIKDSSIIGNYSVCCYRKEIINKIPDSFWEYNTNDWGLNMLMGTFGPIRYYDQKMSVYRLHNESLWTGTSVKNKYQYILDIIPYYKTIIGDQHIYEFDKLEQKINSLILDIKRSELTIIKLKKYIKQLIS
jgi:glycosyltransferase involved in cell wall biosynthesis